MKTYKAIFFDAGGTLFRPYPSVGHVYSEVAKRYSLLSSPEEINTIFKEEWKIRSKFSDYNFDTSEEKEKKWWHGLVHGVFSRINSNNGFVHTVRFEEFFNELYDIFAEPEVWRLFPEVIPVLKELKKRKAILGIVSNWDSRLLMLCSSMGLESYFSFILASGLVGTLKPGPGIFRKALEKSGTDAEVSLHIGDSLEDDIAGARNAGIDAVLIDRSGASHDGVPSISSLEELLKMV